MATASDDSPRGKVEKSSESLFELIPGVELPTANGEAALQFFGDVPPCKYLKKRILGRGAFGEAFIVERTSDNKILAAKVMDLSAMSSKDRKYAYTEIRCLAACNHFGVIKYVEDVVMDQKNMVIIMEFADGGDLHSLIKKGKAVLSERAAGLYFVQLMLAINHVHDLRMIHRDVKTANLFLTKGGLLKIGDFGFSQVYDQTVSNPVAHTFLGTPYYLAPEMWMQCRYGKKADIWACGIVLYELLTSKRPFQGANMPALKEKVLAGTFEIPPNVSREMAELLVSMLQQRPEKRPTAKQVLQTPLMQHYLQLLKENCSKNPEIEDEVKRLIATNISEAEKSLGVTEEEIKQAVRYEAPVKKESGGQWKDRMLTLADGFLVMSLLKGKEASSGGDRSKKLALSAITSVIPVKASAGDLFLFAVNTTSSNIIIGCTSQAERDKWIQVLMAALDMG
jgi:serine/threonine protein kinase